MKLVNRWFSRFLKDTIFKEFFTLPLTPVETEISQEAVNRKYSPTIVSSVFWAFLTIPAAIFLDLSTITLVLVPIAMVTGSAWFAISLSVVKAKFAGFGNTLTQNILESFVTSLLFMLFMAVISLLQNNLHFLQVYNNSLTQTIAAILTMMTIIRIVYLIIVGSIKYDMNDAMLTGQNEAAQEFFTRSMNFSYQVTDLIRRESNIQATNYYISDGFSRIFNTAIILQKNKGKDSTKAERLNELVLQVLKSPEMEQNKVHRIFLEVLLGFKELLNPNNKAARKIGYVDIEMDCLQKNPKEGNRAKALRYATIFTLLYEIVTDEGQDIFL